MNKKIHIVPAQTEHYDAFLKIYNQCFQSKWGFITPLKEKQSEIAHDCGFIDFSIEGRHYVALEDGKVTGIMVLGRNDQKNTPRPNLPLSKLFKKYGAGKILAGMFIGITLEHKPGKREIYIDSLGVDDVARGRGIGTLLLDFARQCGQEESCDLLSLYVMLENGRAKKLYERQGFTARRLKKIRWFKNHTGYSGFYYMTKPL